MEAGYASRAKNIVSFSEPPRIGILGPGRVGRALGRLLADAGEPVAAVAGRDTARTRAAARFIGGAAQAVSLLELPRRVERFLIAVPDRSVTAAAASLAESGVSRGAALHTCGALGPEALQPLADQGVACGVFHPLQTFPTPEAGLRRLGGIAYGIAGSPAAQAWGERLAGKLGGRPLAIPEGQTALYHAAAVMASNALVGVMDAAAGLMESAGVERTDALSALQPLAEASLRHVGSLGIEDALTGPIRRGDCSTVEAHLRALERAPGSMTELYRATGLRLLAIARRRGLRGASAAKLETILRGGRSHG